jgi:hypothetical protein
MPSKSESAVGNLTDMSCFIDTLSLCINEFCNASEPFKLAGIC